MRTLSKVLLIIAWMYVFAYELKYSWWLLVISIIYILFDDRDWSD